MWDVFSNYIIEIPGWQICNAPLAQQQTIHYLCPQIHHDMVRHDTYFGDCKSPYSAPANYKFARTGISGGFDNTLYNRNWYFAICYH